MELLESQISAWKKKYGKVHQITIEADGESPELIYVIRKPNRTELGVATSYADSDPIRSTEFMLENCLLHGDKEALEDVSIFLALSRQLAVIMKERSVKLGEI